MKEILKQAFDKANDIVTRFERNELSLREKVDGLNTLIEETETKVKKVSANSCVSGSYREQANDFARLDDEFQVIKFLDQLDKKKYLLIGIVHNSERYVVFYKRI